MALKLIYAHKEIDQQEDWTVKAINEVSQDSDYTFGY
jgi:hypothetical protein